MDAAEFAVRAREKALLHGNAAEITRLRQQSRQYVQGFNELHARLFDVLNAFVSTYPSRDRRPRESSLLPLDTLDLGGRVVRRYVVVDVQKGAGGAYTGSSIFHFLPPYVGTGDQRVTYTDESVPVELLTIETVLGELATSTTSYDAIMSYAQSVRNIGTTVLAMLAAYPSVRQSYEDVPSTFGTWLAPLYTPLPQLELPE